MSKTAPAIAAIIGIAIGLGAARLTDLFANEERSAAPASPAAGEARRVGRWYGEKDLPEGTLAGLTATQKIQVLRAMNRASCDCGGPDHSCARSLATDPGCTRAPAVFKQAVELGKANRSAEEIVEAIRQNPTTATAPAPVGRLRDGALVAEQHVHAGCADDGKN